MMNGIIEPKSLLDGVLKEAAETVQETKRELIESGNGQLGVTIDVGMRIRWYVRYKPRRAGRNALRKEWVPETKTRTTSPYRIAKVATPFEMEIFAHREPFFALYRKEAAMLRTLDKQWSAQIRIYAEGCQLDNEDGRRQAYKAIRNGLEDSLEDLAHSAQKMTQFYRAKLKEVPGYLSVAYSRTKTGFEVRWYKITKYQRSDDRTYLRSVCIRKGRGNRVPETRVTKYATEKELFLFREAEERFEYIRSQDKFLKKLLRLVDKLIKLQDQAIFIDPAEVYEIRRQMARKKNEVVNA